MNRFNDQLTVLEQKMKDQRVIRTPEAKIFIPIPEQASEIPAETLRLSRQRVIVHLSSDQIARLPQQPELSAIRFSLGDAEIRFNGIIEPQGDLRWRE